MRNKTIGMVTIFIVMLIMYGGTIQAALPFDIGGKIGLARAAQEFNYADSRYDKDYGWRTGVAGGWLAERKIGPMLAGRMEVLYVPKGHKANHVILNEADLTTDTLMLAYRVDYISVEFLAKATLSTGTYLLAGPRLDIKIGSHQDNPFIIPKSLEDEFKPTIVGITLGAGQEFNLTGFGTIFIEGQYYWDLGKLYNHDLLGTDKVMTLAFIKNKAFAIFAGIRF